MVRRTPTTGLIRKLALALHAAVACAAAPPALAVVTVPGVGPYAEVVEGLRRENPTLRLFDARNEDVVRAALWKDPPEAMIAVGPDAALLLDRLFRDPVPVVNTVLFRQDFERLTSKGRTRTSLIVDLPAGPLIGELRRLFPGRNRVMVVRGPMRTPGQMETLKGEFSQAGYLLSVADCPGARELLKVFARARQEADFVWCLPDPGLYTSATLKPLLLASLANRVPLIGFSYDMVRAGALMGAEPDYLELGRQTGEAAARIVRAETVAPSYQARKYHFAYNERVARLMGLKTAAPLSAGPYMLVIR